ncbi:VIT1/CCC1 transporter family protein [Caldicoprobacter algeriensis]|uniref:VIT1/CCC1 transporter family protein n=1 Tax=Caldicoprobacter algeriensis TaxID=699281 RepID=UPI002079E9A1|nr:VIT1/CCC1 transporter family protein [Caldicoprobacter algeriensis]MCM8899900.1 VIT1/CCC1 transporter family protein [Caldicoprobacter algeriensis]
MDFNDLTPQQREDILAAQKNEITEYHIYTKLSASIKDQHNKEVLAEIADEELAHYKFWQRITRQDMKPDRWKVWLYFIISRVFGLTFGVKLMEKGEQRAEEVYTKLADTMPEIHKIVQDEDRHEKKLMELIEEEHLNYVGSMVLGLNDALVELTGTLAGLIFALQNTRLIALSGFITGIAASFSMAASEYLSIKSEGESQIPIKAAIYTGLAYVFTVLFLIFPYLLFESYFLCLGLTVINAVLVILIFNFYVSVAKDLDFKRRFLEMVSISLGVAVLSFLIGFLVRVFLGVEV